MGAVGRRLPDRGVDAQANPRVLGLGPRASPRSGWNKPGSHRKQGPRTPPRRPLLGVGTGADRNPAPIPEAEGPAGRGGPALLDESRDQRALLRDAPDEATPGLG